MVHSKTKKNIRTNQSYPQPMHTNIAQLISYMRQVLKLDSSWNVTYCMQFFTRLAKLTRTQNKISKLELRSLTRLSMYVKLERTILSYTYVSTRPKPWDLKIMGRIVHKTTLNHNKGNTKIAFISETIYISIYSPTTYHGYLN